jgi:hypothetical protein
MAKTAAAPIRIIHPVHSTTTEGNSTTQSSTATAIPTTETAPTATKEVRENILNFTD